MTYYDVTDTDTDYVVYTCGDVNDASDFSETLDTTSAIVYTVL